MITPVSNSSASLQSAAADASRPRLHPKIFAKLDTNGDGGIGLDELQALTPKQPAVARPDPPEGGDGLMAMIKDKLAKDGAEAVMNEIDVNRDGMIDQRELAQFIANYEKDPAGARRPPPTVSDGTPPATGTVGRRINTVA